MTHTQACSWGSNAFASFGKFLELDDDLARDPDVPLSRPVDLSEDLPRRSLRLNSSSSELSCFLGLQLTWMTSSDESLEPDDDELVSCFSFVKSLPLAAFEDLDDPILKTFCSIFFVFFCANSRYLSIFSRALWFLSSPTSSIFALLETSESDWRCSARSSFFISSSRVSFTTLASDSLISSRAIFLSWTTSYICSSLICNSVMTSASISFSRFLWSSRTEEVRWYKYLFSSGADSATLSLFLKEAIFSSAAPLSARTSCSTFFQDASASSKVVRSFANLNSHSSVLSCNFSCEESSDFANWAWSFVMLSVAVSSNVFFYLQSQMWAPLWSLPQIHEPSQISSFQIPCPGLVLHLHFSDAPRR